VFGLQRASVGPGATKNVATGRPVGCESGISCRTCIVAAIGPPEPAVVPTDTGVATFLPSSLFFSLHPPAWQCSSGPSPTSSRLSLLLRSHHRRFSAVIYSSPCVYFSDTSGVSHEARVRCGRCGRRKCGLLRGACRPRAGWARLDARESSTGLDRRKHLLYRWGFSTTTTPGVAGLPPGRYSGVAPARRQETPAPGRPALLRQAEPEG
jgi:hypothetical protein